MIFSWESYENATNLRLTWTSGTTRTLLGNFEHSGSWTWDTTQCADGIGVLKVEYLDANGNILQNFQYKATIINDANIAIHRGNITESETWTNDKIHLVVGKLNIPSGAQLTIAEGSIVKFWKNAYLYNTSGASVTIQANATLTRVEDDSVGGDTNKDGTLSTPKVGNSYVRGSGTLEMADSVTMKFIATTTSGTISASETWFSGQVYHVTGNLTVASGATLTILPGAIVKFDSGCSLTVGSDATLVAEGNAAQPIIFTSVKDDSYGGDIDEDDGENEPEAGDWDQIGCNGGTIVLNHVVIQYCSSVNNQAGIFINSGNVTFNNSRISFTMYDAMRNYGGNFSAYNSIFEESSMALSPRGGTTEIVNCVIANSTTAIRGTVGNLVNTVIYNITSVIFDWGVINCDHCVIYNPKGIGPQSATVVGSNGNIWSNPLFRNASAGDYHLMAGSPCIDAADGSVAPTTDITGSPRNTDVYSTQTGTPNTDGVYADIGAYEFTDNASSSIDLEPVNMQAPAATVGDTVTIQWTVRNHGTVAAKGTWTDAIYLVSEYGQKVLVKDVVHAGNVASGDLQTFYAEVVEGAIVLVENEDGIIVGLTYSDAEGNFTLYAMEAEVYKLYITSNYSENYFCTFADKEDIISCSTISIDAKQVHILAVYPVSDTAFVMASAPYDNSTLSNNIISSSSGYPFVEIQKILSSKRASELQYVSKRIHIYADSMSMADTCKCVR